MSNHENHDRFETEPVHIQEALGKEVDRLLSASQQHQEEGRQADELAIEEKAKGNPELHAIENRVKELLLKDELTDEETTELTELRARYDEIIKSGGTS